MPTINKKVAGTINYIEVLPAMFDANRVYNSAILFHGMGGIGMHPDTFISSKELPPEVIAWADALQMVILAPIGKGWSFEEVYINEMIRIRDANNYSKGSVKIITGLSMGGGAVVGFLSMPGIAAKFTAAVIVCGIRGGWGCEIAKSKLPIIFFHATIDEQVPLSEGRGNEWMINNCGATVKPLFVELPDGGHWIWGRVYNLANKFVSSLSAIEWAVKVSQQIAPAPPPIVPIAVKAPEDFMTNERYFKLRAVHSGEDWNKNKATWKLLAVPAGMNAYHNHIFTGGGWISCEVFLLDKKGAKEGLPEPGDYVFEVKLVSVTGKEVRDKVTVNYMPKEQPIASFSYETLKQLLENATPEHKLMIYADGHFQFEAP